MFSPFQRGLFGIFYAIISALITFIIILWVWRLLNPAELWFQIILLLLSFLLGTIIFFVFMFLMAGITLAIYLLLLRRRVKKSMKKLMQRMEM